MTKRKITKRKKNNFPTLIESRHAFEMIDQLMLDLATGEVNFAEVDGFEQVVFRTTEGDYLPSLMAMRGWVSCWERFKSGFGFQLNQKPLEILIEQLEALEDDYANAQPITPWQVHNAQHVIDNQRAIYRRLDVYQVREYSRQEIEAIRLEDEAA